MSCTVTPEEYSIVTRHLRVAARTWGAPEPPPVVALHGWLDNAASFDPLGPLLGRAVHLIALDLAGHGLSDPRPPGVPYHFVDFVQDLIDVLDALGLEDVALLGHSLGAGIAAFAAAVAPQRVRRLALIEGIGPSAGRPEEEPGRLREAIAQMARLDPARKPRYPDLEAAAAARARAGDLGLEAARFLAARGTMPHPEGGLTWRSDRRLTFRSPIYLTEEQVRAFLRRIEAPTLLVSGSSGLLAERPVTDARIRCIPILERHVLPGGHHLHMEDPEAVAEVLLPFLTA